MIGAGLAAKAGNAMALFGRRKRASSGLLTGTISARNDDWEVTWIGDGVREPPRFTAGSLTEAAEQAAREALAVYTPDPGQPESELQLVVFPWPDGGDAGPIYEITDSAGAFRASDSLGIGGDVSAATLEDLVTEVAGQPGGADAMLQWVRRFSELPSAATGFGG
jgi:hypothetical protein